MHFSPIQNHILSTLKHAKELRYRDLQPADVANDLFNYHLQQLVKKEFLVRGEQGYWLSEKGLKFIADPFPENDRITSLFKVNVLMVAVRQGAGGLEVLNQVRMSNPSYGKVGVMGGIVWKGETMEAAAKRKFREETGLEAEFKIVGCERRMMYRDGELFSDVLFPIGVTTEVSGELMEDTDFGRNMWVPIEEAIINESADYDSIQALPRVLRVVQEGTLDALPFFMTEEVQDDGEAV